jgi:hypothetical protein
MSPRVWGTEQVNTLAFRVRPMRTLGPIAALISCCWLLAACANPEAAKAARAAAIAEQDSEDDAQCRAGGAEPGSAPYDDCRSRLAEARVKADSAREQRKAAFQQTTGAGTEALSGH